MSNRTESELVQTERCTTVEQLASLPDDVRVAQLLERLLSIVAEVLGVAEQGISPDAPFAELHEAWADPWQAHASLKGPVEELIARPFHSYEFWRSPYRVGPIGSIRQLAEHLGSELVIPAPQSTYADPYQGGTWPWGLPALRPSGAPKNPPAAFVLAGPRSGSTLLRVMLARHPSLFCGPELHLLLFERMARRHRLLTRLGYPWMEWGLEQSLALLGQCSPEEARERAEQLAKDDVPIQEVYRLLQGQIGQRLLVDKSPSYTAHPAWLSRAEDLFEEPKYLYLTRHPSAAIESFVRMRFHWLIGNQFGGWDANPWLFAEKGWAVHNRNAMDFLRGIADGRQHWVRYEDLVGDPEATMQQICGFLGIPFDDAVLHPYQGIRATFELGDPNLLAHAGIDPALATAWEKNPPPQRLSPFTKDVAAELGYTVD
jgi:phthiocerol/phenolphthiocerol synthesis type-I polyketide synthase E